MQPYIRDGVATLETDLPIWEPLRAYLYPGRVANIERTYSFPFPLGFKR